MRRLSTSPLIEPDRADVRGRITRGLAWKAVSQTWSQITRTIVTITLARLLGPVDFGVASMVLVLSALVVPLSDLGLGVALVQRKTITEVECSTVFWASIALGVLFTAVGVAVSPLVADFYHQPRVGPLFAVLSFNFLITGLGSTHRSLLYRAMDFRSLELRLMIGGLLGGISGIALAAAGAGPWAIIVLQLVQGLVSTVLVVALGQWRPSAAFSLGSLRSLGPFGGRYVGTQVFTVLNMNADNLLIGRYLGASSLGLYTLAYSVILVPLSRITNPLQEVFYSGFSRLQDDSTAIAQAWTRTLRLVAAVSIPLTAMIAVTASDAIPAFFGARWSGAAAVVRILAFVSLLQILQALHPAILGSTGRMKTYLRFTAGSFVVNLAAFVVGLRWGIVGVATCFAIVNAGLAAVFTLLVTRAIALPFRAVWRSLRGLLQPGAALIVVGLGVRHVAVHEDLDAWARIAVVASAGLIAYVAVAMWSARDLLVTVSTTVRHGLRMRSPT